MSRVNTKITAKNLQHLKRLLTTTSDHFHFKTIKQFFAPYTLKMLGCFNPTKIKNKNAPIKYIKYAPADYFSREKMKFVIEEFYNIVR